MTLRPLDRVNSIKVKLGSLVVVSVLLASIVATVGRAGGVPPWLSIPVTILIALGVTQLLAAGMTSPLRQMTTAARQMATGDYGVRVAETSRDEVGQLARTFNSMAGDLDAVDQRRRELVANVSHELRTPLAGLCAVLENAVDGVGPGDARSLQPALDQAERLSDLVNDLLDLARIDAGEAELSLESVALASLLADCVAECVTLGRPVTYDVRVVPRDLAVQADQARLRQLVANLLDNASRHSPSGSIVQVHVSTDGERWRLDIRDAGPGVEAADRERVFERFGTLNETGGGGGTGLGLAISRWVSDLHGGEIRFVDPPTGIGACVRVLLPIDPALRPPLPRPEPIAPPRPIEEMTVPDAPSLPAVPPLAPPHQVEPRSVLDDLFGSYWPDRATPARTRLVLAGIGVGVLAGLILPFNAIGLGTFVLLLAAGGVIVSASPHRGDRFTVTSAALCVLLAATTVVRDADWIVVLCAMAGAGLCLIAVARAHRLLGFAMTGFAWGLAGLRGLPWLGRSLSGVVGPARSAAVLRTLAWSALGLVVFGALFASADALLAQWVDAAVPDLTVDTFVLRGFVAIAVAAIVLAATYLALNPPRVDLESSESRPVSQRYEWLVPVAVVNAAFAAFLVAQGTVIFGGADYLRTTTGLTYSEYSRQGFAQLTVATGLTLLVVALMMRKAPRVTDRDRLWLRVSVSLLCGQTLIVVASALYRMGVYQDAYGFTRLRLLVDVFEGWLGLVVLAALISGLTLRSVWLPRFALVSGVGCLLALAAINPDAWIAEHNIDRFTETGKIDYAYLGQLSDDALPTIARLPAEQLGCVALTGKSSDGSWLEWNLGRHRAEGIAEVFTGPEPECFNTTR